MTKPTLSPTPGELMILRALWSRREPMTVREVHAILSHERDTAYTTVLKMLTIMANKGLVRRDESSRSHTYRATYAEATIQGSMLRDLVSRAFSGSAFSLVQRALDDQSTSDADLDAIARLIAQARADRRKRS